MEDAITPVGDIECIRLAAKPEQQIIRVDEVRNTGFFEQLGVEISARRLGFE